MLRERMMAVARRKERLLARCEGEREAMSEAFRRWAGPAQLIDRVVATARTVRSHPALVGVAMLVAAVLGRKRLVRWAGRGLMTWRAWRGLLAWMRRIST